MVRVWAFVIAVLAALGFAAWASDFVTMQGERTDLHRRLRRRRLAGRPLQRPGRRRARYRYRALKPHGEVIFWTVGSKEPSGKFRECTIQDGRNWACKVCPTPRGRSRCRWRNGVPVAGPTVTRPFRAVSKWRWLLSAARLHER